MIWFFTGVPGSGKSYHVAKMLYHHIQNGKNAMGNMDFYIENVPQRGKRLKGSYLRIPDREFYNNSVSEMKTDRRGVTRICEPDNVFSYIQGLKGYAYNFHERDRKGRFKLHQTLIIIDEAHELFNSRSWNRKDRLAWCSFFRVHRKLGYDIILISQDDKCIDKQIRSILETCTLHRNVANYKLAGKFLAKLFGGNLFVCITTQYGYAKKDAKTKVEYLFGSNKYFDVYDTTQMY